MSVCRNDQCFSGSWSATETEPVEPGSGVGFLVPDVGRIDELKSPHARVTIWNEDSNTLVLEMEWTPWTDGDLHDGDRYRLSMTDAAGDTRVVIDRIVEAYDWHVIDLGPECGQLTCRTKEIDSATNARGAARPDGRSQ